MSPTEYDYERECYIIDESMKETEILNIDVRDSFIVLTMKHKGIEYEGLLFKNSKGGKNEN